jgi:homocysteine S-methyltransferase
VGKVEGLVLEFEKEIEGMIGRGEVEAGEWPSLGVYPDGTRGEVYDTVKKEWVRSGEKEESSVRFFNSCLQEYI